ncbi:hypothetical protein H4R33_001247 [Dimargaris cristalligena]|uniref:EF-hand domain-containing protein n=1 Tax=Dimargaris cristalligena TaxID=215637 RepID=A0A4P9ZRQ7_9FUNG|nr:hypothetical protein H4R33_001247 [Dimargaris cristalligena]RKP36055.1 hypothetical protein BJ085DRAFT_34326 [Dimargaris cristalligena]|eukprot:RKP36055.1 hypothetical protein BJ085DRAFT_34326 [Dimargaris cristalligena]
MTDPQLAPLLDDSDDLTPEFEQALSEIFGRYDRDGDQSLNKSELQAFAVFCNGEPFSDEDVSEILESFTTTDDGLALTLPGFIQLYHLQTASGDDEETWKDLKKHGYDAQLKLETPPSKLEVPKPDSPKADDESTPAL